MTQIDLALPQIHKHQEAKYAGTVQAIRGHLRSLAATRMNRTVDSDDAMHWLEAHGFQGDPRVVGAVFRQGFVQNGFKKSTRRRGTHATWIPIS